MVMRQLSELVSDMECLSPYTISILAYYIDNNLPPRYIDDSIISQLISFQAVGWSRATPARNERVFQHLPHLSI